MVETVVNIPSDVQVNKGSLLGKAQILFFLLGVGFLIAWATLFSAEPQRALFGYLFSFSAVLSLALGSLGFVIIQHLTRAGWSVGVRRIPETVIATFPLFILFFLPMVFGMHDIFPWTHEDHIDDILRKKLPYLNEKFFLIRSFIYLGLWVLMGIFYYRASVKQDNKPNESYSRAMVYFSAPSIILFALSLTFASFDWIMSLQPHWYSTIFGIYFFAGCFLFAIAFMTLMVLFLQRLGFLKTTITDEHYHDLGKFLFGFTIFWAYIAFSQFMLYWYGAIPEEIEFYTHRMHNGWDTLSWAIPVINFFLPFLCLMSRFLKRVKLVLAINCLWVIFAHLVDLYWLIIPTFNDATVEHGPTALSIKSEDVFSLLGLFFIFMAYFMFLLCKNKLTPVNDPRFIESVKFENF